MTHAIRVHQHGGPEQLVWESIATPEPGSGQALVRSTAIGLNFIDTYHRSGLYPVPTPFIPGQEGAGVVEAVGPGVTAVKPGDRVAYVRPLGAYAERLLRPVEVLIPLPEAIQDDQAAAMMLKGITAQYLLRSCHRVQAGETVLIHAAAGGVGQIASQWARHLGARVIGTVGSEAKRAMAEAAGCHEVIVTNNNTGFAQRVRALTGGEGVPVVYDGLGQASFMESLDCLAPRGLMVSFGNATGPVTPFPLGMLAQKGSLFVTRPTIDGYNRTREELLFNASELFEVVASGAVRIAIQQRYALRDAARAHADLEGRRTTGSTVLTVD
jgi:NADPH2:quinone reductase